MDYCPGQDQQALVLLSGGIDSYVCLLQAQAMGYYCEGVHFDYGQKNSKELTIVKKVADLCKISVRVCKVPMFSTGYLTNEETEYVRGTGFLPGRNSVFLLHAALLANQLDMQHVFIAVHKTPYKGYPDASEEFIQAMQQVVDISLGNHKNLVRLQAPFTGIYKSQVIALGLRLGADLKITSSCLKPSVVGDDCGFCDGCITRNAGFMALGQGDPTVYTRKPDLTP